ARWSRDGRQLFTVERRPQVMTAREFHPEGSLGPARRLFDFDYHYDWDAAPGDRFLVAADAEAPALVFVDGWFAELEAMFPQR
ncbi:MAG TPA: hypothetical protein VMS86_10850, partial [Thermoanaerobaculia bacterium]|nr:hypothetical protein [Thermoanaerobaculia bacterium]